MSCLPLGGVSDGEGKHLSGDSIHGSESPIHRRTDHPITSNLYPILCLPGISQCLEDLSLGSSSPAEEDVETKIKEVVYLRENCRKHWWGSWDMKQRREDSQLRVMK